MNLVISKCVTTVKVSNFSGHYLRNRSTMDIGFFGYISIFNIRNTLPKFCPFLLGHPVYNELLGVFSYKHSHMQTQVFKGQNG